MASFLIDRHSPIRSGIAPKLRHRSRLSESENCSGDTPSASPSNDGLLPADRKNDRDSDIDQEAEVEDSPHILEKRTVNSKSLLSYFMTELTRDYKLEGDASEFVERRDRIYTSVNTPKNLEKFCAFGFLQCLDSILYMVTFLPFRIIVVIFQMLTYPCAVVFMGSRRMLDSAQVCDLLKGVILVVSCFILSSLLDMSMIYHVVKKQSIFKFYVFYNMLDVLDKLVSGFGQDVLDSLYWTAVEPHGRRREHFGTLFHLIFAIVYVVIHTTMIVIQAIILNVAFTSHHQNLLTLIVSSNFVEIKGNLFKRLDKNNLCQITYIDVRERFHFVVLVIFAFMMNLKDFKWSWNLAFPTIQSGAYVMFVEIIVDWIKHAFITKFNELSASSYGDFALGLAQDIASSQKKHAFTNFSDQVCRRMGFTPMPLICLLFMACNKCFRISGLLPWLLVVLLYLCLMSTKVLISIILLGWAQRLITERDKATKPTGTVVNSQVMPKKEEKGPQAKAKPEIVTEVPVPVIITTRPITISSSIAVNTDSTLSVDSPSLLSVTESNENSSISSFQNEKVITQSDRELNVPMDEFFAGLQSQEAPSSTERCIASSNEELQCSRDADFSTSVTVSQFQQTSSLCLVPQSVSDVYTMHAITSDQSAVCDSGHNVSSGTIKPALMDFQTNFFTQSQSPVNSLTAYAVSADEPENKSFTCAPHSSPSHLLCSSKRKQPDSADESFQAFFNTVIDSSQPPEVFSSSGSNNIHTNTSEVPHLGNDDFPADSVLPPLHEAP